MGQIKHSCRKIQNELVVVLVEKIENALTNDMITEPFYSVIIQINYVNFTSTVSSRKLKIKL